MQLLQLAGEGVNFLVREIRPGQAGVVAIRFRARK